MFNGSRERRFERAAAALYTLWLALWSCVFFLVLPAVSPWAWQHASAAQLASGRVLIVLGLLGLVLRVHAVRAIADAARGRATPTTWARYRTHVLVHHAAVVGWATASHAAGLSPFVCVFAAIGCGLGLLFASAHEAPADVR